MKEVIAADLFCGAGGASTALRAACDRLGRPLRLVAVNHWLTAIQTHSANHPDARHYCASIEQVDPREAVPGGRLQLLMAAPECTQHSRARGGRPIHDQQRVPAWQVLKWLQELYVENLLLENVEEFREWGPLGADGYPLRSKRGATYRAYLAAIESLGYRVDDRVLNSADYGDHTSRRRLFIQATRGRRPIRWPAATHSRTGQATLMGPTSRWRPARDVIDWSIHGTSIFHRPRPLAANTMRRVVEGLKKFGGREFQPFVMHLTHGGRCHSVDAPLPTITGAHRGELALAEPFVLPQQSGGIARGVSKPLPTIATAGAIGLVRAWLVPGYGERSGQSPRTHGIDDPLPTIPASSKFGLCEAFLTTYYSSGGLSPVSAPVPTITTRDRIALVQPVIDGTALDVTLRMLRPHELARAMGFPVDYQFAGTGTDKVKQVGNAWPVGLGQALIEAILGGERQLFGAAEGFDPSGISGELEHPVNGD